MNLAPLLRHALALILILNATRAEADLAQQRRDFEAAMRLAGSGQPWARYAGSLADYPLLPLVEYRALQAASHPDSAAVEAFVARYPDSYPAERLRGLLAERYARASRWQALLDLSLRNPDDANRCRIVEAKIRLGRAQGLVAEARKLWLRPDSAPAACDPVFDWLRERGQLARELIWQRIGLAALHGKAGFVRHLGNRLSAAERPAAQHLADLLEDPRRARREAARWPIDAAHRRAISYAVARIARRDHALAASLFGEFDARFAFRVEARARMLDAIALYRANDYSADAADWLARIPAGRDSASSREWRLREALSRQDFKAVLAGFERLDAGQQAEPRWQYWRARALAEGGQMAAADAAFRRLAASPSFFGFLAADRLGLSYRLCPKEAPVVALPALSERYPELERALELRAIGWHTESRRAFAHLFAGLEPGQRHSLIDAVDRLGWFDRGPLNLLAAEDLPLYRLRFPLAHANAIATAASSNKLDPSYLFGLIRAESAWLEDAHSHADAYGLMQLLWPSARSAARTLGMNVNGPAALFDAEINIRLGSRHLASESTRFAGSPWLVAAAYNAGPQRVEAWLKARGQLPTDIFIETIPYRETREYVARVLAFTQIYDWRQLGAMRPLSARLPALGTRFDLDELKRAPLRPVSCPATPVPAG